MNRRYIPNALTCGNLICGCIATGAGFHHHFTTAFIFIILGAVFDFFDGFAARLLNAPSKMGIELDSLADDVTFGVAPSAMIFTLFTEVRYPEMLYSPFWFKFLPFTAFLLAAFSAYRLAKFNLDERQRLDFIGLPTPACAIFWASFISSSEAYLTSPRFNAPFLFAFMLMFCFLLISEIPMFSLKFKHFDMRDKHTMVKFGFVLVCIGIMAISGLSAESGHVLQSMSKGLAGCIGLYILTCLVMYVTGISRENDVNE